MKKTFFIKAKISEIKKTTQEIISFVDVIDISDADKFSLEMVINEALSNAVQYGSIHKRRFQQGVEVNIDITGKTFSLYIKDPGGKIFDPEYFENMALLKEWGKGGRGIFLIKDFMDTMQYIIYPGKSTLLFLSKEF